MYATFSHSVEWPMDDRILLGHIDIPQVRYALLSYLVHSYTPQKLEFVEPLLRIAGGYPALAGLVLCRMAKLPANHRAFLIDNMSWLKQIQPFIGIRLLFLVDGTSTVRTAFSQFLTVYTFLADFATKYPDMLLGVTTLVVKFPACAEVAGLLGTSGLLETLDRIGLAGGIIQLLAIHAYFDKFVMPRDFEVVLNGILPRLWPTQQFTQFSFAVICTFSVHADGQRALAERNIQAVLTAGDYGPYQNYLQAIVQNCSRQ
jgi:hypothetical protein